MFGRRAYNNKIFSFAFFLFIPFATQLFSTPVTSSNLRNQAPLFTELCLLQATLICSIILSLHDVLTLGSCAIVLSTCTKVLLLIAWSFRKVCSLTTLFFSTLMFSQFWLLILFLNYALFVESVRKNGC